MPTSIARCRANTSSSSRRTSCSPLHRSLDLLQIEAPRRWRGAGGEEELSLVHNLYDTCELLDPLHARSGAEDDVEVLYTDIRERLQLRGNLLIGAGDGLVVIGRLTVFGW